LPGRLGYPEILQIDLPLGGKPLKSDDLFMPGGRRRLTGLAAL
jgi:hypothetical protein